MGFGLARIFNGLHWFFDPALRSLHCAREACPRALTGREAYPTVRPFGAKPRCATTRRGRRILEGMIDRKSTPDEIRRRFDQDVERFSNLDTGQSATMDAPLALDLVARAAHAVNPQAATLLDIGCGAGNYTLKLMQFLPLRSVTLVDLSRPMLDRAVQRIASAGDLTVEALQADIRDATLPEESFDIAVAAATLHHLRRRRMDPRLCRHLPGTQAGRLVVDFRSRRA